MRRVPCLLLAALALLAGCGKSSGLARECPNLNGSFALSTQEDTNGQFDLLGTYLAGGIRHAPDRPWRSVVIEGDSKHSIQLTFVRPAGRDVRTGDPKQPAYIRHALETPFNTPLERERRTVLRGRDYDCKLGWITPAGGGEGARIRRDAGGDLDGELSVRRARVFSLWAETGAGIPYWFDTTTRHARWPAIGPQNIGAPVPPQAMDRLARQEYELTYGKPSSAGGGAATDAPYDVQNAVRAHIDRNAQLESLREEGGRRLLTLRVESRGPVTRTLENLGNDPRLIDVQDHGSIDGGVVGSQRTEIATLSFRVAAPR